MRLKLYQTDETLFNSLDYNDDDAFMNTVLFYYLFDKENKKVRQLSDVLNNHVEVNPNVTTEIEGNTIQPNCIFFA